jgi:hypothetical protein
MSDELLLWRHTFDASPPCGAAGLLRWQEFHQRGNYFEKRGEGQASQLVLAACAAAQHGVNISVGWGTADPSIVPADEVLAACLDLRPSVTIMPMRADGERWVFTWGDSTAVDDVPAAAIWPAVLDLASRLYPRWVHDTRSTWRATAFAVRHTVNAQQVGLVAPEPLLGDRLLNAIANDVAVRAAFKAEDAALPETTFRLADARLLAQERLGIRPDQRSFLYSGEIEGLLNPILFDLRSDLTVVVKEGEDPGAKISVLALLRERLRPYGDLADTVLRSILRDYPHEVEHLDRLREAAAVGV